jgi:hypothetical protein
MATPTFANLAAGHRDLEYAFTHPSSATGKSGESALNATLHQEKAAIKEIKSRSLRSKILSATGSNPV